MSHIAKDVRSEEIKLLLLNLVDREFRSGQHSTEFIRSMLYSSDSHSDSTPSKSAGFLMFLHSHALRAV